MGIIKEEHREEYNKRASEIKNVILNAYGDYYSMVSIEPYFEKYKPQGNSVDEERLLSPAQKVMDTIVRAIQEEFILIICSLEDKDNKANSLIKLKEKLRDYLADFDVYKGGLNKMPSEDNNIKGARNAAIAHINFNIECERVYMKDVKNRLDVLKDCFNSYLFGDVAKYKIDKNLIEKIKMEAQVGVQELFSGFVSAICNKNKLEGN